MSVKHTPGKWEWAIDDKDIYIGPVGCADYRNAFASVDYDDVDHEEAQANANLIAAAPDLLEALEGYVSDCTNDECERCISARAALARATGKDA